MRGNCAGLGRLIIITAVSGGCSWFTDFKEQPRIEPWEAEFTARDSAGVRVMDETIPFRGNPQFSVPLGGIAVPGYVVSYEPLPGTLDSMSAVANPVPVSERSLDNGRKYYQINCAVCHGANGSGNGPAVKYGVPAPTLLTPVTQNRTDGYLFGIIRNGRGLMPTYGRIEEMDRWDVVNYMRALQGRAGVPADTSPAGIAGQNGNTVPGASRTAPTVPVPYFKPGTTGRAEMTDSAVQVPQREPPRP
ncbi:MAG: cytochrome c [Gemmatimonadaceae bacterium]